MKPKVDLRQIVVASARKYRGEVRLSCKSALQLATKYQVTPRTIGKICDQTGIKLRHCELGCF